MQKRTFQKREGSRDERGSVINLDERREKLRQEQRAAELDARNGIVARRMMAIVNIVATVSLGTATLSLMVLLTRAIVYGGTLLDSLTKVLVVGGMVTTVLFVDTKMIRPDSEDMGEKERMVSALQRTVLFVVLMALIILLWCLWLLGEVS